MAVLERHHPTRDVELTAVAEKVAVTVHRLDVVRQVAVGDQQRAGSGGVGIDAEGAAPPTGIVLSPGASIEDQAAGDALGPEGTAVAPGVHQATVVESAVHKAASRAVLLQVDMSTVVGQVRIEDAVRGVEDVVPGKGTTAVEALVGDEVATRERHRVTPAGRGARTIRVNRTGTVGADIALEARAVESNHALPRVDGTAPFAGVVGVDAIGIIERRFSEPDRATVQETTVGGVVHVGDIHLLDGRLVGEHRTTVIPR